MMHILALLLVYLTSYFYLPQVFGVPTNAGPFDKRLDENAPLQMYEVVRYEFNRDYWNKRNRLSTDKDFDADSGHCEGYPWNVGGTVGTFDNVYMSTVFSLQSSFGYVMCYLPKREIGEMLTGKYTVDSGKFNTNFTEHFLIKNGELSRAIQKLQNSAWKKDCVVSFRIFGAQIWTLKTTTIFARPVVEQIERSFEQYLSDRNHPLNGQRTTFGVDRWYFTPNNNKATSDKNLLWTFALLQTPMDAQGRSTVWIWLGGAAERKSSSRGIYDLPPVSKLELSSGRNLPPLVFMEGKLSS